METTKALVCSLKLYQMFSYSSVLFNKAVRNFVYMNLRSTPFCYDSNLKSGDRVYQQDSQFGVAK